MMMRLLGLTLAITPLLVFWLWMFWDFVNNHELPAAERNLWLVAFVFFSIVTAIYYYLTAYTENNKR